LRLVRNWSYRRQVYGEDNWLKPTRLRDGALRGKDVELLRAEPFMLLTPPDLQRSQVFIAHFGRLQGLEEGMARQRLIFYIMVNELNASSQRHGIDALVIIDGKGMKVKPDNGQLMQATKSKTACYVKRCVLVWDPTDSRNTLKYLFQTMLVTLLKRFWGDEIFTVCEDNPAETRKALENLGFHPSTIPIQLGGDLDGDKHIHRWLEERFRIEGSVSSGCGVLPRLPSHDPSMASAVNGPMVSDTQAEDSDKVAARQRKNKAAESSDRKEKITGENLQTARLKSAYYSRRSYYRKKEETIMLADECQRLRKENQLLQEEGARLESLSEQVHEIMESNRSSFTRYNLHNN